MCIYFISIATNGVSHYFFNFTYPSYFKAHARIVSQKRQEDKFACRKSTQTILPLKVIK